MNTSDWIYWELIKKFKKGHSFERWSLRHLHHKDYLDHLAEKAVAYNKMIKRPCHVRVNSVWIDGTPQAFATARTNKVKCELADLLYIVEELDSNGDVIRKKGVLIQGKNTIHPKKLDSGNSTKKERALFQKLDRTKELVLKVGTSDSSKVIGKYLLDLNVMEGLSDCARFLLMPKHNHPIVRLFEFSPFHITWPKNQTSNKMLNGQSLSECVLGMYEKGGSGREVISPDICEWSRIVCDLENKYEGVKMKGYEQQKRIYSSDICSFTIENRFTSDPKILPEVNDFKNENPNNKNLPYISIIKVTTQYTDEN